MPFIDDADVQVQLPYDKLKVEAIPDDLAKVKQDAERIIRGYLAGVFDAATLAAWSTPDTTPGQIRAVGGRFAAALIYRVRFSESSLDDPEFAQKKYDEAMFMLQEIIAGRIVLDGVVDVATDFSNDFFWPNSNTADPKFAMDSQF